MAIISPVLPQLGVTDVVRSNHFYCEVLGFSINWEHFENNIPVVIEVQHGPSKLQLAAHDGVRDNAEQRSARRATILFFETDDVAALHSEIERRGGKPGALKIVDYWMRMRMFCIYDPDDHALWFGQRITGRSSNHDHFALGGCNWL